MTEAEWLGSNIFWKMVDFLGSKASERKLQLFACACAGRLCLVDVDTRLADLRTRFNAEGVSERYQSEFIAACSARL